MSHPTDSIVLRRYKGRARQQEAWERAARITPAGVMSNFRYWGEDNTPLIARGKGSHIWDLDDNEFIDFRNGFGAIILGHGYEPVIEASARAAKDGSIFTLSTLWEVEVAERLTRMIPGLEMVRFCNSGTEATQAAVRVARAYTGKDKLIKFEGHFHGAHDHLHFSTAASKVPLLGPRNAPTPQPMSRGIASPQQGLIFTLPFQDYEGLERVLSAHGHEIAALISEPVMGNAASLTPEKGWFDFVRQQCTKHGVVFILDEVKTGFRVSPGGASKLYGIEPDLTTWAKALGNGYPVAFFGGKREVMQTIKPGVTAHTGTFNGNVAALAAANQVLATLEDGTVLNHIAAQGHKLMAGIGKLLSAHSIPHLFQGPAQMFGILLTDKVPRDFRDVMETDLAGYTRLMEGLFERGVMAEPDVREPWFLNAALSDDDVAYTLAALEETLREKHPKQA